MKLKLVLTAFLLLLTTACITVNVPLGNGESVPMYQWTLRWAPPSEEYRAGTFSLPLRIKDLDASGSYQLSGMVVVRADGTLEESSDNRWAARPGAMLAEMLSRDIIAAGGFPAVFRTASSVNDIVTVEGYVREFGALQVDSTTWMAVLDVDVTLLGSRGAEILLQKNYRYQRRMPGPGFGELAEQLSALSATWAEAVRGDICSVLAD
jgi:ABC-type uncharacterized transport system auxiliary subunit